MDKSKEDSSVVHYTTKELVLCEEMKYAISVIIPSRNEMFLAKTIEDILIKTKNRVQVIAVLDGEWAEPPIDDHPNVVLIHYSEPIGQRAGCNRAASIAEGKYIIKCDAHCGFDEDFDIKLLADMQDDWTLVPVMRNLWAFDWVCNTCGSRWYQGPTPIKCLGGNGCVNTVDFYRDIKWIGKTNPQSDSYCFNTEPQFQYFKEYRQRPEYINMKKEKGLTETMSLQGSFFMMTKQKYFELNICDEKLGSWGSQGIEVAVKTWLSGGRCIVSHKTWYGHMFRTQGGDFGFPYPQSDRKVKENRKLAGDLFFNNKWNKAKYPFHWLIEKFMPVSNWTKEDILRLKNA